MYVAGAVKLRNDLDLRAAQVRAQAWAPTTWRTKSSQWKKYVLFCSKIRVPALPTDCNLLCRYIVSLEGGLQYGTIDNYVSGVLSLNKYFGFNRDYIRDDFVFITTMAGLKRILGDPEPTRPTLDISDLLKMYIHVDLKDMSKHAM